jgi:hypothetical protein
VVPCGVWNDGARFARASPALCKGVFVVLEKGWRCVVTGTDATVCVMSSEVPFMSDADEGMFVVAWIEIRGGMN